MDGTGLPFSILDLMAASLLPLVNGGKSFSASSSARNKGKYCSNNRVKGVVQDFYMVKSQENKKEDKEIGDYLCRCLCKGVLTVRE